MTDQLNPVGNPALSRPTTTVYDVTRDAIRRFAVATGATADIHQDVDAARRAGYPDLLAPPYFFVSLGLAMDQVRPRSELSEGGIALDDPLAANKVVAGETTVDWFGSIFAGDVIEVERSFVSLERKRGKAGLFDIYVFRRDYTREGSLLIRETYGRIAR